MVRATTYVVKSRGGQEGVGVYLRGGGVEDIIFSFFNNYVGQTKNILTDSVLLSQYRGF